MIALLRLLVIVPLLAAVFCFAVFALKGDRRYLRWGRLILGWTLLAAFGFFAVLIAEHLA